MITNILLEPNQEDFNKLSTRPKRDNEDLDLIMQDVFGQIAKLGDMAVKSFTKKFDNVELESLVVTKAEIEHAVSIVSQDLKSAISIAKENITKFHKAQLSNPIEIETINGVVCTQRSIGIERVGIYIPGGTAPLFSTVLMLAIPATLAGCKEIMLCTPPDGNGNIHPAILYASDLCGITNIYKVGGAQAIASMSIGTESIPSVSKVFGPGNQYVTAAKIYTQRYGVAMDMPAGPSELLVFADDSSVPSFIASDLLSQAEHGGDSQVILVATNNEIVEAVNSELNIQIEKLPRKIIAQEALVNSKAIVLKDKIEAFKYINEYAPEHLIIASEDPNHYVDLIVNAGSIFLGNYCPESAGDYASGTNHTLPTDGWAKSYNGANVDSFSRKVTFQSISKEGIDKLGPTIITMAEAEQLNAHAEAVKLRLEHIKLESK